MWTAAGTLPLNLSKQFKLPQFKLWRHFIAYSMVGFMLLPDWTAPWTRVYLHNCFKHRDCGWTIIWKGMCFSACERRSVHTRLSRAIVISLLLTFIKECSNLYIAYSDMKKPFPQNGEILPGLSMTMSAAQWKPRMWHSLQKKGNSFQYCISTPL